jgi:hypothetical protein
LARHLGVSRQTLHRWKKDPKKKTPEPTVIDNVEHNNVPAWDQWMKAHVPEETATDSVDAT